MSSVRTAELIHHAVKQIVGDIRGCFQLHLTDAAGGKVIASFWLRVDPPKMIGYGEGESPVAPDVTITTGDQDFIDLLTGELHAIQAFMKGKIKVKGKIMLLQKAEAMFRARDGYNMAKAAIGMAKL